MIAILLSFLFLICNAYGAERASWWFKAKCYLYEYCLPAGSMDDKTLLPHSSIKFGQAFVDAVERHSIPDVSYMHGFFKRFNRSLVYLKNDVCDPLHAAVKCNAPSEIVRLICNHTWVAGREDVGTLLKITAQHYNAEAASILLEHKPNCTFDLPLFEHSDKTKAVSFIVGLMERLQWQLAWTIHTKEVRDLCYKERTAHIEAVLNAQDAATYQIPTPVNAIIAGYAIENLSPKSE